MSSIRAIVRRVDGITVSADNWRRTNEFQFLAISSIPIPPFNVPIKESVNNWRIAKAQEVLQLVKFTFSIELNSILNKAGEAVQVHTILTSSWGEMDEEEKDV